MPIEPDQSEISCPSACDSSPVEGQETLMRRILKSRKEYDREIVPPVQKGAFLPTKRDDTGLSVNRQKSKAHPTFLTPEQLKNWHSVPQNIRETCGVVEILAQKIIDIGLTVNPDPAETPGHVLISELNWIDFNDDTGTQESRDKIVNWALVLSRVANVSIIPGKKPSV